MWEINLSWQIQGFLASLLCGAAICIAFDILTLCVGRLSKQVIFIFDILFFIFVGFFDFCLLLVFCNGELRGYIFAGEALGFLICKLTLAKVYIPLALIILRLIKRLFLGVKSAYLRIFIKIFKKGR